MKKEKIVESSGLFRKVNKSSGDDNVKTGVVPKMLETARTSETVVSALTEHVSDKP